MKNLKNFELAFDNGRKSFCGGEIMRGSITVDFEDEVEIQNIQVRFYGEAFSQPNNVQGIYNKQKSQKKESVVNLQKVLFGYKDGESVETIPTHPHGIYRYDFQFMVPKYLPCSFESPKERQRGLAFIHYFVEATITRPWKTNVTKQIPITVSEVIDTTLPEYSYRPGCQTQKELGTCISDGILSLEAYVDNICYNQGDYILISCEAENDSNRIMTSVYAKLFKRTRYRSKKETKTYLDVVAEYFGDRILPRNSVNWENLKFKIPQVGPTITKSNRVNVDFFLRVGMYQLFRDEIHVDLPIVIGVTKDYLVERRLTEEDLKLDVSVTVDPIAARERRLNEVDRQRLEDIADIFMRMPHEGKRPSVQYINALARKNRRQHSVESTPRQTPQYDSEDSFIDDEKLQMSRSIDLLQSGYYEDPNSLSPSRLSSRRASETNLYTASKSDRKPRVLASTPTPRSSVAGLWSKGNTPRQTEIKSARPSVRKAASHSNIQNKAFTSPDSATGQLEGLGPSPRKSPSKRPSVRKTASQGKIDMKEAAMIAAGIGNVRRKGALKIKSQGGGINVSNEPEGRDAGNDIVVIKETAANEVQALANSTEKTSTKKGQASETSGSSQQNGPVESSQTQDERKQTTSVNRLKSSLKMPVMSPIHSAAESGTESPGKELRHGGSSQARGKSNDLQSRHTRTVSSEKPVGAKVRSTAMERSNRSNSKLAAVAAFKKGNKSFVGCSKKDKVSSSEIKSSGSGRTASDKKELSGNRKISTSDQSSSHSVNGAENGRIANKSKANALKKNSLSNDTVKRSSDIRKTIKDENIESKQLSMGKNEVNNNVNYYANDDEIIEISEQNLENVPEFDINMANEKNVLDEEKTRLKQDVASQLDSESEHVLNLGSTFSSSQMFESRAKENREAVTTNKENQLQSRLKSLPNETGKSAREDTNGNTEKSSLVKSKEIVEEGEILPVFEKEDLEHAPAYSFDDLNLNQSSDERERASDYSEKELANEESFVSTEIGNLERAPSLDEFERFETEILGNSAASGSNVNKNASVNENSKEQRMVCDDEIDRNTVKEEIVDRKASVVSENSNRNVKDSMHQTNGFTENDKKSISNQRKSSVSYNGKKSSQNESRSESSVAADRKVSGMKSKGDISASEAVTRKMSTTTTTEFDFKENSQEVTENGFARYDVLKSGNNEQEIQNGLDVRVNMSQALLNDAHRVKEVKTESQDSLLDGNQNEARRVQKSSGREAWQRTFTKIRSIPMTENSRRGSIVNIKVLDKDKS